MPVMEKPSCSTSTPQGICDRSEVAESIYVQGIRRALHVSQLLHDISRAVQEKKAYLDEIRQQLEEREKNELYEDDLNTAALIPYGFKDEDPRRSWVKDVFVEEESEEDSDDDEVTEEDYREMLKLHRRKKKYSDKLKSDVSLSRYMYYSSDFVTGEDKWPTQYKIFKAKKKKKPKVKSERFTESPMNVVASDLAEYVKKEENESDNASDLLSSMPTAQFFSLIPRGTSSPSIPSQQKKKKPPNMETIRKRHWKFIAKKEIPKAFRIKSQLRSINVGLVRRVSRECMKKQRAAAALSVKLSKDKAGKARRITREMQLFWKKYSKVEKVHRKKAEKHALEQIRLDEEIREAKRQQRKLNFLISQTELFAHFISKKLTKQQDGGEMDERMKAILSNLEKDYKPEKDNVVNVSTDHHFDTDGEDHDGSYYSDKALKNVKRALNMQKSQTAAFDSTDEFSDSYSLVDPSISATDDINQPALFNGVLKSYQLKGMNWLINLYQQGINGILADEMGLGKTVQTIAFLGHLAETINIWGPFLVVAPASTLNNWHQEFSRFFPDFKVLPYWGNTAERRVLRKFWNQKASYHSDRNSAPFHILITSYQLVISDVRYFQRIKWQYMVLDEAQALKSSSSVRWKILLDFNCRNRLLLTGTPIQNSMAELWALLHFIMPSLFDSHEEFNEWFSKDIENHIENKSNIDETQLSRLHMILKPFMLRRIKRDVENELSEKIEIRVHCSLTPRQKVLYNAIKQNIRIEDLLRSAGSTSVGSSSGTALMNLVMQFRKVCNHPDLFERREVVMPLRFNQLPPFLVPKLLYHEGIVTRTKPGRLKMLYSDLSIHHPLHVHSMNNGDMPSDTFSFLRFLSLEVATYGNIMMKGTLMWWLMRKLVQRTKRAQYFEKIFRREHCTSVDMDRGGMDAASSIHKQTGKVSHEGGKISDSFHLVDTISLYAEFGPCSPFRSLLFTRNCDAMYAHQTERIRIQGIGGGGERKLSQCIAVSDLFPLYLPPIFQNLYRPKATSEPPEIYCCDRNACNEDKYQQPSGSTVAYLLLRPPSVETNVAASCSNKLQEGRMWFSPFGGWSDIYIPTKEHLVTDSGKLYALDILLKRLKHEGHRVLIYSQMTRMIDLLEEYMWHRRHTYIRLDGSSRISERRDMVADFQARSDIFAFLLSTRAGGLGINLTAADTVIFYDSDWNPTVDQQAMDRAHRLGQTKQVTVYRLVCQGTVDERILQRAEEKNAIQRMVISGGSFHPDALKAKEVVSLLLDDEQLMQRLKMRKEENRGEGLPYKGKKRGRKSNAEREAKRVKQLQEQGITDPAEHVTIAHTSNTPSPGPSGNKSNSRSSLELDLESISSMNSAPVSPSSEMSGSSDLRIAEDDLIIVDDVAPLVPPINTRGTRGRGRGSGRARGRPRIRPLMPEGTRRRNNRPTTSRGRTQGRNIKRGRKIFTGRAAAMAGARAGAVAASAAAYAAYGYGLEPTTGMLSQKDKPISNTNSVT